MVVSANSASAAHLSQKLMTISQREKGHRWIWPYLAFLLEETARKILPEAVLACCVSGIIHVRCGYYRWGSRDAIRYSDIDAASVCVGSHSTS